MGDRFYAIRDALLLFAMSAVFLNLEPFSLLFVRREDRASRTGGARDVGGWPKCHSASIKMQLRRGVWALRTH